MKYKLLMLVLGILVSVIFVSAELTNELQLYYSFNESSGVVLPEKVNSTYNATIIATPEATAAVNWTGGILGNALNFTGGGRAVIGAVDFTNTNVTTISFWFNSSVMIDDGTTERAPVSFLGTNEYIAFGDSNAACSNEIITAMIDSQRVCYTSASDSYAADTWHHVVLKWVGEHYEIWVNGINRSTTISGTPYTFNLTNMSFSHTSSSWNGVLDEIGIWNRSLTDNEIGDLYAGGVGLSYPLATKTVEVTLNSPTDASSFVTTSKFFNATVTPSSLMTLDNATYYIWYSNHTLFNSSFVNMDSTSNETTKIFFDFGFADYIWNLFACGSNSSGGSECNEQTNNFTFTRNRFSEIGEFYKTNVTETSNETFQLNISLDSSATLYSASLVYNGTSYPVEESNIITIGGGNYSIIKILDIPTFNKTTETRNFNWTLNFNVGTGFETQSSITKTQTITYSNITIVGSEISINFSIFDEDTLSPIYADFGGSFEWYLGGGSNSEEIAFDKSPSHEFDFYTLPRNRTHYTDATIQVLNNTANLTYSTRNFDFRKLKLSNLTQHQRLMLLNASKGRDVIIELKDVGLNPVEDYIIQIERYYPSQNIYRLVESQRTDIFGQIVARLIENDERYRFRFYNENNNLVKEVENTVIACRATICKVQFVIEDDTDIFEDFDDLNNHNYNFTFNNNTNIFTFVWNDDRGETQTHRLEVKRRAFNGTTMICNTTSVQNVGLLSCNVGDSRASYTGNAYRKVGTSELRLKTLSVEVGDLTDIFGLEGIFWSFLLLATTILIGLFYPPVGIVLFLATTFVLGLLDIIYINPAILIAEIVIGGFVIWAFRG